MAKETSRITRLRSYKARGARDISPTICQACLATSAAPTFFGTAEIGDRKFVDGGLGANNPVSEVETEAMDIWCRTTGDLKPLIKCFISIGTGHPGLKPISDNLFEFVSVNLTDLATNAEKAAVDFVKRYRGLYDNNRYFRFSVEQGLQGISLDEYKKKPVIEAATDEYLDGQEQKFRVEYCVRNLATKQSVSSNFA
jgi:predicted acylesterase/phospholipase RssA